MPTPPQEVEPHRGRDRAVCRVLLAVLALACLLRAPVAAMPLERDEGEYAYIAWRWLEGELPYATAFDQKPPGVFAAYAGILASLGRTPSASHWGAQIWTLGTLALVLALGRRMGGLATGAAAATLLTLLTTEPTLLGNAANTEMFMLLPLLGALIAALRARERDSLAAAGAAGILSGAAILFKQPALWNALYAGALVLGGASLAQGLRRGLVFAGALAATLLAPAAGYVAAGAFAAFWDCVVGHNLAYAESVPLAQYPQTFWATFSPTLRPLGLVHALAALGVSAAFARGDTPFRRSARLLAGFGLASGLGVATGGYFRQHYYLQAAPALALLAALGLSRLLPPAGARRGIATTIALGVILGVALSAAPRYWLPGVPEAKARRLYGENPFPEAPLVADWIAGHTAPEDTVFVFGSEPEIYFLARRRAASRYIYLYPLMTSLPDTLSRQRATLAELAERRPAVVVTVTAPTSFLRRPETPAELFLGLRERLLREYRLAALVPAVSPSRLKAVSEQEALRLWARDPGLGQPEVWGSLAVWERRP